MKVNLSRRQEAPQNNDNLIQAVSEEWEAISIDFINNLIESMPNRFHEVLLNRPSKSLDTNFRLNWARNENLVEFNATKTQARILYRKAELTMLDIISKSTLFEEVPHTSGSQKRGIQRPPIQRIQEKPSPRHLHDSGGLEMEMDHIHIRCRLLRILDCLRHSLVVPGTRTWGPGRTPPSHESGRFQLDALQTQHTTGYGEKRPTEKCSDAIVLMCIQNIVGLIIEAFLVGIFFAKMTRPKLRTQTIKFSKHAVIYMRDNVLCLVFRVGDMRKKSGLIETKIKAKLIRERESTEGELLSNHLSKLPVSVDDCAEDLLLIWPVSIVHKIDEFSPLYKLSADDLVNENFEIVVTLEGTVESTDQKTQARSSYLATPKHTLMLLDSIQRRAIRLVGDATLTHSLTSLEHRRKVGDLSLFYRYFHGKCSSEISAIIPSLAIPIRRTRQAQSAHPFVVNLERCRTALYQDSFIHRTARLWNSLPVEVFPTTFIISKSSKKIPIPTSCLYPP
ncbi:unnamed protein product [Phaedon cochleariae]|uniref:Inward rectifier potassium channel C-terminal domain-containing protein n=1 Tax=Phaedon cochleariae TaxID=80249 RepID=A0A9N9SCY8_PHACE|nr:unnamed protein product [Phaedon cochleariae]